MTTLEDMPKRETKFNDRWLDETDGNGHKLRLWCSTEKSDTTAYCFVCKKTIQCGNAGYTQVLQHSVYLAKIACSDSQTKIAFKTIQNSSSIIESQGTSEVSETIPVPVRNICVTSKKDDTTKAITVSGQVMVSVIHLERCSAILKHSKLFQ